MTAKSSAGNLETSLSTTALFLIPTGTARRLFLGFGGVVAADSCCLVRCSGSPASEGSISRLVVAWMMPLGNGSSQPLVDDERRLLAQRFLVLGTFVDSTVAASEERSILRGGTRIRTDVLLVAVAAPAATTRISATQTKAAAEPILRMDKQPLPFEEDKAEPMAACNGIGREE
nr:unnamed protein product [Digitaria exilis]